MPAKPDALAGLPLTALIDRSSGRPWPWFFSKGAVDADRRAGLRTDDVDAECAAVRGRPGLRPAWPAPLAEPWLQSGALVAGAREPTRPSPGRSMSTASQRTPVPARVRLVYDELVRVLR